MSQRCVVLVGMMGAGKSEVGELLADQLGYTFIDTDTDIKKQAGKSIPRIFSEDGEEAFRKIERATIARLAGNKSKVISVGGGAIVDQANRKVLSSLGHVVYLRASAKELYQRVKNDKNRPLLQTDDPLARISELLEAREFYYEQADITIDTEDLNVDEVVDKLIDELAKRTIETDME